MKPVHWLFVIALFGGMFVAAWQFATQNAALVNVYYILGTVNDVSLGKALSLAFLSGVGVMAVVAAYSYLRSRLLLRSYRKATKRLENEIHQLRNLPIEGEPTMSAGDAAISDGESAMYSEKTS
jgi:uncharacterized membrane protein YciS (DUF1049 family)